MADDWLGSLEWNDAARAESSPGWPACPHNRQQYLRIKGLRCARPATRRDLSITAADGHVCQRLPGGDGLDEYPPVETAARSSEGPIFLTPAGQRLDRHGAGRVVRSVARRAGLAMKIGPHTLRHAFITGALTPA